MKTYILKDKIAIFCNDFAEWSHWMGSQDRTVMRTQYDNIVVSTVFLGIDHQYGQGDPLLFETMVFEDENFGDPVRFSLSDEDIPSFGDLRRYSFWGDAEEGHKAICAEIERRIEEARTRASDMTSAAMSSDSSFEP